MMYLLRSIPLSNDGINLLRNESSHTTFSNKASLYCKQGFFTLQTRLLYKAKKPCFYCY